MDFRPASQHLRDINLQALGKFSCLVLVLGLESVSHPADLVQVSLSSQGTASPSFVTPLDLGGPARARARV